MMDVNFRDNSLQGSEAAHEREVSLKMSCFKILREWEATNSIYEEPQF